MTTPRPAPQIPKLPHFDAVGFHNPDGTVAVVAMNTNDKPVEFTLRDEPQQVALRLVESCQVPHYSEHQRHCVQLRLTEPCITGRLVTFSLGSERECKRLASEINNAAAGAGAIEEIFRAADTLEDFALRLSSTEAASSMALRPECGSFFFRSMPTANAEGYGGSEGSIGKVSTRCAFIGVCRRHAPRY